MNAPAMKRLSAGLRLLVLLAAACLTLILPAVVADEVTAPPGDTGERIKNKTEQMNASFSALVDTIAADDSDTFSPAQKKHLQGLRDQAKNETTRTPPQEFKHQSRNRRVDCVIRERLGDVDDKGKTIGNEDGLCDKSEMDAGGCAEVIGDGIGDDDGICESKGKFDEACVEDCDVDLTMAKGKEDNVHQGKRADLEQSLNDMTGVLDETNSRLKTDGSHRIFKRPMRAHELLYEKPFQELLEQVDNETTILMGHTRWRTRGNEFNNRNNHPIRAGIIIGTHNGTIYNADHLFRRLGLPRYAEVDSELLFRLADRFAPEGPIDQEGLKKALALCRGQMSAVLASKLDPGTITVLKGNKPLCLRIHRQHRVVLYASDDAFIDFAVDNEKGWRELEVPPMTMLTIRHEDVRAIENSEFRFIPQERKGTLPEGVNA